MKGERYSKKVTLELVPWMYDSLDIIRERTGISFSSTCRDAICRYLYVFIAESEIDFVKSIENFRNKDLLVAMENWENLEKKFKKMGPAQVQLFKKMAWELLRLLKQKKRYIMVNEAAVSLGVNCPSEINLMLTGFFEQQKSIFPFMNIIPEDDLESVVRNDAYYNNKWREYGANLKNKKIEYEKRKTDMLEKLQLMI